MELIYIWIKEFRSYSNQEVNLSDHFNVKYNKELDNIKIVKVSDRESIYPVYIKNINAIVGRNGSGKTNLVDLIGMRKADRNKNNAEYTIRYQSSSTNEVSNVLNPMISGQAEILQHYSYFQIYYIGKDAENKDLFCIDGNCINDYLNLFECKGESIDNGYFFGKNWFSLICTYERGKLIYQYYLETKHKNDYTILNVKDKLDFNYYNNSSIERNDEPYIMLPRRVAIYDDVSLSSKIKTLVRLMDTPNREIYKDNIYTIEINYNDFFLREFVSNHFPNQDEKLIIEKDMNHYLLNAFVCYLYNDFSSKEGKKDDSDINKNKIMELLFNRRIEKDVYLELIRLMLQNLSNGFKEYVDNSMNYIEKLVSILMKENKYLTQTGKISFEIKAENNLDIKKFKSHFGISEIDSICELVSLTFDAKHEYGHAFNHFFKDFQIRLLSSGEEANLNLYTALYDQIKSIDSKSIILLLDEPDAKFHPELSRNFINDLINFLGAMFANGSKDKSKKFQIIVTTHSPFILSDILPGNIVYLTKEDSNVIVEKKKVKTFAGNIHSMLIKDFYMNSTIGEFAKNKIQEIVEKIQNNTINEYDEKKLNYIVNSIGEPIIKNKLKTMINEYYTLRNRKDPIIIKQREEDSETVETIKLLEMQIQQLKRHIRHLRGELT